MASKVNPGTNFSNNNNSDPGQGILGNLYNRAARAKFNAEIWGDNGDLEKGLNALLDREKELLKMSKEKEKYDVKTIKRLKDQIKLLQEQRYATEKMINQGEASDKEALDRSREQRAFILKTLELEYKAKKDNENLSKKARKESEMYYQDMMKTFKSMGEQVNKLDKDLLKGTSNTFKALGTSITGLGDNLVKLTNMFNLDKLANNAFEQSARNKLAIQNQLTKQYGINASQFSRFKSNMFGNLSNLNANTGNIFSTNDMLSYMQKLDKYNITNTKIAEQQMKNSVIANKYLSVSDETQTNIFKYMKATNDYTMLDKHNQTITGLLKSQLGVSTDQLDQLTQLAQSTQDVQYASGMSVEAMNRYQETSTVLASVLSSQLGSEYAKSISSVLGKMVSASYQDIPDLVRAYGVSIEDITRLQNTGDVNAIYNKLLGSSGYSRYGITGTVAGANTLIQDLGADTGVVGAMRAATGKDTLIQQDYVKAMKNIKDGVESVEDYVQQTTQITSSEKVQNGISTYFGDIAWEKTIDLANIAFGAMVTGNVLSGLGSISDLATNFKVSHLVDALTGSLDKSGITNVMSKLSSGAIVLGLTGATIRCFD